MHFSTEKCCYLARLGWGKGKLTSELCTNAPFLGTFPPCLIPGSVPDQNKVGKHNREVFHLVSHHGFGMLCPDKPAWIQLCWPLGKEDTIGGHVNSPDHP